MSLELIAGSAVMVIAAIAGLAWSRVKVAGPDQAFIVTGRRGRRTISKDGIVATDLSGQKVVMGAALFVWPIVQRLHVVSLASRRIRLRVPSAISASGVKVNVEAVAIIKVGGSVDSVRAAAQRFLHQQSLIEEFTDQILSGSLRSVIGKLTVEQVIGDRSGLAMAVSDEAEGVLNLQGLVLDGFLIEEIGTDGSYLTDLGRPELARAAGEAAMAETRARQAAEQERMLAEERIAEAERSLALKRAAIQAEIDAAKARSSAAGQLARAEEDANVLQAQQVVAERNAELKERQLDTEIRKPADARRYEMETDAEARKNTAIIDAEARRQSVVADARAEADSNRILGEAERDRRAMMAEVAAREGEKDGVAQRARRLAVTEAVVTEGEAEADAIRARGEAEADVMRARGRVEADNMRARAESFERYGQAALLEMLITALPHVVEQASKPMESIDSLTVISTDGASELTKNVAGNVAQGLQLTRDLTGVDLPTLLAGLKEAATRGETAHSAGKPEVTPVATPRVPVDTADETSPTATDTTTSGKAPKAASRPVVKGAPGGAAAPKPRNR